MKLLPSIKYYILTAIILLLLISNSSASCLEERRSKFRFKPTHIDNPCKVFITINHDQKSFSREAFINGKDFFNQKAEDNSKQLLLEYVDLKDKSKEIEISNEVLDKESFNIMDLYDLNMNSHDKKISFKYKNEFNYIISLLQIDDDNCLIFKHFSAFKTYLVKEFVAQISDIIISREKEQTENNFKFKKDINAIKGKTANLDNNKREDIKGKQQANIKSEQTTEELDLIEGENSKSLKSLPEIKNQEKESVKNIFSKSRILINNDIDIEDLQDMIFSAQGSLEVIEYLQNIIEEKQHRKELISKVINKK